MEVIRDRLISNMNHQLKESHSNHGKPEWEKSAIRICGYWSEQLSSKGKIYFYNSMTEVSQWQKPIEWILPDMNRKDLLKLLNDRKSEGTGLKRQHFLNNYDGIFEKIESVVDNHESHKRAKISNDFYRSGSSQMNSSSFRQINNSGNNLGRLSQETTSLDNHSNHRSQYVCGQLNKKSKTINCPRASANDDMEISPDSSPLSDTSSTMCSAGKSQSPHKHFSDNLSPQVPRQKVEDSSADINFNKSDRTSTLCQLVDAIRASIDGLFDKSITPKTCGKSSPSNGVLYSNNRSPNNLQHRSRKHEKVDQLKEMNYNHVACDLKSSQTKLGIINSKIDSKQFVNDSGLKVATSVASSLNHRSYEIIRSSPSVISPHLSHTNSNATGNPRTTLSDCTLSSHQVDELMKMLSTSKKEGQNKALNTVSSRIHKFHDSNSTHNDAHCTNDASKLSESFGGETINSDPNYQRTQLSDLVQVLKAALDQQPRKLHSDNTGRSQVPASHGLPIKTHGEQKRWQPKDSTSVGGNGSIQQLGDDRPNCNEHTTNPCSSDFTGKILPSPGNSTLAKSVASVHDLSGVAKNFVATSSPNSVSSSAVINPATDVTLKKVSPNQMCDVCTDIPSKLDTPEMRFFVSPSLVARYNDESLLHLEHEAHLDSKTFDQLQSVLYSELSAESKKLRALVRISEAKLAIHKEKQNSLQQLMDAIETKKHLPNLSFVDLP